MSNPPDSVKWHLIQDVQLEITRWADEQFPGRTDHQTVYKLVVHEIPELMVHKKEKGTAGIGTELADCFILLMDLASMWGVDLTEAIRAKMEINYGRIWERDAHGIMQHVPIESKPMAIKRGPYDCPHCQGPVLGSRELTPEEKVEVQVQWGNQSVCPYDSVCLGCNNMFDSNVPF